MTAEPYNVLFLCTGNSARSIFGEVLVNHLGHGRFRGHSAGSHPRGEVQPLALELLDGLGYETRDLRSKDWSVYAGGDAPHMDFVFTVCDRAAAEPCPVWPGQPMTAHWGIEDPAAVSGTHEQRMKAYRTAFHALQSRLRLFMNLPLASIDRLRLGHELDRIGRGETTTS